MAKVVTVVQYEAVDGSVFTSEAECNAHEFKLAHGAEIDAAAEAFLNTIGAIDRSRNMQGNVVKNFLAFYLPWVDAGKPAVERTVFDTPKEVVEAPVADEVKSEVAETTTEAEAEEALF